MMNLILFFLLCIEPIASFATEYFVDSTNGNDNNNGISLIQAWKTLGHSISQLQAGDTLYLRGGVFYESQLVFNQAGTSTQWITLKPWNNETVSIDGSLADFRNNNNAAWQLVDSSRSIYRSIKTYNLNRVHGYLANNDGHWRLITYENFDTFSTSNEMYAANPPYYYVGPGVYFKPDEQKIYIRLQHSIYQISQNLLLPTDTNANNISLNLFADKQIFQFAGSASYFKIENISLFNQYMAVEVKTGAHHIQFSGGKMLGGRDFVLIRDLAHDIVFDGINFSGYIPNWIARSDVKHPTVGRPAHLLQGSAINISDNSNAIEIKNCYFDYLFDAIDATKSPHDLYIHDNYFNLIRDDVIQLGSAAYNVEISHNKMINVTAGISWNGSGAPTSGQLGKIYIHHNIIDSSSFSLYGRIDPNNQLDDKNDGPNGDGMATGRAFGMHTKSAITIGAPWKIYDNTVIVSKDVDNRGIGASYYIDAFSNNNPHEVYNNIFIQKWDSYIIRSARTHDGSQIFDGNLYYRSSATQNLNKFYQYYDYANGNYQHFNELGDFIGSSYWQATQNYYADGWDVHSVYADPQLNSEYIPAISGMAASGAIDLSNKTWPGANNQIFRGALNPLIRDTVFINGFE